MDNKERYNQIKNLCSEFYSEMDKLVTQVFYNVNLTHSEYLNDLKNYLFGSSKQIRSCLIFLFAQNFGYKSTDTDIIKLAAAVEIIHNATLIHDDIIDNSALRRGNIAMHEKYSNKLGVISGDFLLSIALDLLLELPPIVMKNFASCLTSLCLGEISQYFSIKKTPTIDEYFKKSEQKTSSLFVAGLKSLIELKYIKFDQEIKTFAIHFGRAFQIKDDLKNIISTDKNKPILNDIEQGTYTLPVILAFGENVDLSQEPSCKIIKKVSNSDIISNTIIFLNKEVLNTITSIEQFPINKYKNAILELCKMLNIE